MPSTLEQQTETLNPLDLAFYWFQPRPDNVARYDEQTAFMESRHAGLTALLGGNGSGKSVCALMKAVEFLLYGPPPLQRDFQFWVISNTFQQVMNICWKEKMHNFGLLPPHMIDWARIRWYDKKSDWPHAVPLIDHRESPGRNWVIEFKSQDQGRETFQGESIGGFVFTEQFNQDLLTETMMRCRVFGGYGNKLAEFCPINPEKSIWLQEMDESGKIPESWGLYHTNTECAVEAGQFDKNLFRDAFATVPLAMRETRMKGLWGSYSGLVYPEFNPTIHCISEDEWEDMLDMRVACYYRRAMDYGQGPENPFACIWACRNGLGQWFIYDEYYSTDPIDPIKHLKRIHDQQLWPKSNPYYGMTWADPSAEGAIRIASRLTDYAPGYDSLNIQGANHDRDEGINHVRWLLDRQEGIKNENGDPQPMLFVVKEKCPNLIREFRVHRYLQSSGLGLNPQAARAEVLKKDDHLLDALRYLVFSEHCQTGVTPQMISRHRQVPKGLQFESKKFKRGGLE